MLVELSAFVITPLSRLGSLPNGQGAPKPYGIRLR